MPTYAYFIFACTYLSVDLGRLKGAKHETPAAKHKRRIAKFVLHSVLIRASLPQGAAGLHEQPNEKLRAPTFQPEGQFPCVKNLRRRPQSNKRPGASNIIGETGPDPATPTGKMVRCASRKLERQRLVWILHTAHPCLDFVSRVIITIPSSVLTSFHHHSSSSASYP